MGGDLIDAPIFNSPFEVGLRAVTLLVGARPLAADVQKLVYLDYASVHSGDFEGGPASIHPATPARSSEFLSRRDTIEKGLLLMASRGLVDIVPSSEGILYKAADDALPFIDCLTCPYFERLRAAAKWAAADLARQSVENLGRLFSQRAIRWGSEFLFMRDLSVEIEGVWKSGKT